MKIPMRVAGIVFAGAGILLASSARADAQACYQVELEKRPYWVSGATWLEELSQLVVVDPAQNKLLSYSPLGEEKAPPEIRIKGSGEFQPNAIAPVNENGFILELADGTLVRLDRNLRVSNERLPAPTKSVRGYRVGSLYQWKVADSFLVAYGALLINEKNQFTKGFFRVPLKTEKRVPEMLTPLADGDFYLIGNTYIATIGNRAYYVAMGKRPVLYEVSPGRKPKPLDVLPEEFRARPDFKTHMTGPNSAAPHFAELETFSVISGLYAHDEMLYLLARRPNPAGTTWLLYKIDPRRGKLFSPEVVLPTSANHLTVAPSKDAWYLLERGPVGERQQQEIAKMVVVESSAISSLARFPRACPAK